MTAMRMACCAALALSACYSPKVVGGAPCDPAAIDSCPSGQSCVATAGGGGVCTVGGAGPDAGTDSVTTTDGGKCLGKGLLGSVCLSQPPTTAVSLSGTVSISTATVGGGSCNEIRAQNGGPSLCLVVATTINIAASATVRATGPNPLVLIATQSITVNGALDASSEPIAGAPVLGAGARTALDCTGVSINGLPGKITGNVDDDGAGGGAGGSLGTLGGSGGTGGNGNVTGGNPVMSANPSVLVGGCPGGRGGNGAAGSGGGAGGNGGGAVYLLAGDSISVTGKINASGAGGTGGIGDNRSGGGGGGGGSGGMIALEAPHITVMTTGSIYANGGGGAGGCGNDPGNQGQPGLGATAALTVAAGGSGGNGGGGNGGNGSAGTIAATGGQKSTNIPETAGGGGGGGAGIIRVFGVPASSITVGGGIVSPPAR